MPNLTKIVNLVKDVCRKSNYKAPVKRGKEIFSNLYICQMVVVQNLKGYTNESEYLRYLKNHQFKAFPKIPSQSQYNQRSKELQPLIEELTEIILDRLGLKSG